MEKKLFFLFALLLFIGNLSLKADEVTFKASAPDEVAMGEQFRLTYTVNAESEDLRAPDMKAFDVLMGPSKSTSRSVQMVEGKSSSTLTENYTYILMPKKKGSFNLAPATIQVKNTSYKSNSLVIKVTGADTEADRSQNGEENNVPAATGSSSVIGKDDIFVRMIIPNQDVYEQEGFLVTFKLYSLHDAGFENVKYPGFESFLSQDLEINPQWALENYNGKNYNIATIKQTVLYPQRSGKITIESGKFNVFVRMKAKKQARSFFDDIFDTHEDVKIELTTSPLTVNVKPLPSGKPASFSGAVGNYTMDATINSNRVKTNEAVTIKLTVNGTGNIKLLKKPDVIFPNGFDIGDPQVDNQIEITAAGASGTRTFEYVAVPRYAGDYEIPAVQFSYFDPKAGVYKTVSSEPFKLHVETGNEGEAGTPVTSGSNRQVEQQNEQINQDDAQHKSNPFLQVKKGQIKFNYKYLMLLLIPLILLIAWCIWKILKNQASASSTYALPFVVVIIAATIVIAMILSVVLLKLYRSTDYRNWRSVNQTDNRHYSSTGDTDIMMVLDISTSMLAEDFKPNRLEAVKDAAAMFINSRANDKIGLVLFAGESFTRSPLTTDHAVLLNFLNDVDTGIIEDGTAIGVGLINAINQMKDSQAQSKVILLLTDGSNNAGEIAPATAAEIAGMFDLQVFTIGLGTKGKAPYPFQTATGMQYKDIEVSIDEPVLQRIAAITGGRYFRATDNQSLEDIYTEISQFAGTTNTVELQQQNEKISRDNAQQILDAFVLDEKDTQEKVKQANR